MPLNIVLYAFSERIGSADGPPDVEKAEMEMRSHTYADPSGVEQYVENVEMKMKSPIYSDLSPPDVENVNMEMTSPICSDISAIERQEFPGTHDVYTVVDKTKKTPKPEDHLPSYQVRRVQGLSLLSSLLFHPTPVIKMYWLMPQLSLKRIYMLATFV